MNAEEDKNIAKLDSDKESDQKAALKWMASFLEEDYILNLPASVKTLSALEKFSKKRSAAAALKTRAKNLIKKYQR